MTPPARFQFRLQSVLDLREAREQAVASRLAVAADAARQAQDAADALASVRASCADDLTRAQAGGVAVGTLRNLAFVLDAVDSHLGAAGLQAQDAAKLVDSVRTELADAARDRTAMERLRDRHADAWAGEVKQHDQRTMDDVALSRYARRDDGESHPRNSR